MFILFNSSLLSANFCSKFFSATSFIFSSRDSNRASASSMRFASSSLKTLFLTWATMLS
ncbi:MAG: 1-acyl-sn-glycerol-3-phosphate acyltransferase [Muribaculaceae bacterium]|nr:1-acyl-sn-glycerol-3-phosphate acyltransferase [Muribaculaceae bacterium]MDE6793359.1 1-acyl-sn-glycerol-3-phosphate acyltransferase [Muribaculaceae bacterium]